MYKYKWLLFGLILLVSSLNVSALSGNGKLQIHHIDVEQGDATLVISPNGQLAMIDNGNWQKCSNTIDYLQSLGITNIDYHFATHYHADHIGCIDDMATAGISIALKCYDRGNNYGSNVFNDYINTCASKRETLIKNQVIKLDENSANPVNIKVVDLNGAGISTTNENSLSAIFKISYGEFDEVIAGDLTGVSPQPDVESVVGPEVGDVEVYKVNHQGSKYSSNDNWLNAITPEAGIISVGSNSYGHPTSSALNRIHNHKIKTYWTNIGSGVSPDSQWDKIGGNIKIEITTSNYSITGDFGTDTYQLNTQNSNDNIFTCPKDYLKDDYDDFSNTTLDTINELNLASKLRKIS